MEEVKDRAIDRFYAKSERFSQNLAQARAIRVVPATLATETGTEVYGATILGRGRIIAVLTATDAHALADALVDAAEEQR